MSFKGGSMFKNFKPLGDRVLIKRLENEDVTAAESLFPTQLKNVHKQVKSSLLAQGA
jgi:co-chaperonin GroES (HSP10)